MALTLGLAGGAFFPISAQGLVGALLDLNPIAAFTRGLGITASGGGLADHLFNLPLKKGRNVLSALVLSGSGGWRLEFGGPKRNRLYMASCHSLYALYVEAHGAV